MNLAWNRLKFLAAATMAVAIGAPVGASAAPPICPQFIAKYCVYNSHHVIFTAETNPCFAKERHWTVIYPGECHFRHH